MSVPPTARERAHPLALLGADIRANLATDAAAGGRTRPLTVLAKVLVTTRLQAVIMLRLGQAAYPLLPPLAAVLKYLNSVITGADIALAASIGPGLRLFHPVGVVIGSECVVGARCTIMQGTTLGAGVGGSPTLGDDVFVGAGAKVFGRLTIGDRSVIGANAVVIDPIAPDSFAAGAPARVIKPVGEPASVPRLG